MRATNDLDDLVVHDDVQECRVDLQSAVIFDEAELPEPVHEEIDPGPCRTHLCCQDLLTDLGYRFHFSFFAEVGEQQENPSKPLFARIEQVIHQIGFDLNVARKQE